jgi:hypothetical protein
MVITILSISLWVLTVLGWVIWNLYNKNKKLEDLVVKQQFFIQGVQGCMKEINNCANLIDSKLWVQSDPEFLSLMENVKQMQSTINDYIED